MRYPMLVDTHIHTSGISLCSHLTPAEIAKLCHDEGYGGIVLTNHYKRAFVRGSFEEWRRRYVEEYEITRREGEKWGLRVFFGMEITLDEMPQNDFCVYGLTTDEVLAAGLLYALTLPELSDYVHARGALLYHAHPFRHTEPVDGRFLDGTEINCHPLYRTCAEEQVRAFADACGLRISCGSDFHGDSAKAHCGTYMSADITTTDEMVEYLRAVKRPDLLIAPDPE